MRARAPGPLTTCPPVAGETDPRPTNFTLAARDFPMYILGLSTLVESAAVLMRDGEVIAAMEEERFTRVELLRAVRLPWCL